MDSSPDVSRLFELALIRYNVTNRTSQVSRDQAARAIVLGLQTLISTNAANASTVTQQI